MDRRVVITGCGAISCVGNDLNTFWDAVVNGRCGLGPVTHFDASAFRTQIAGEVKNFDPGAFLNFKEAKRMDTFCHFAIAASDQAMKQAGLPVNGEWGNIDPTRVGVLVSSGIGGLDSLTEQIRGYFERGPGRISPMMIPMMIADIASGNISIRYGAQGPNLSIATACATGCHSIGEASWMIRRGDAEVMIAGGSEGSVTRIGLAGFSAEKAMSTRNDDPLHASRPFDRDRDGFVMSEGAGVLVLEELEHAKKRGAEILVEVIGYGLSGDGYHITSPCPDGSGAARAMTMAMNHAGIAPEEVSYINAHGTSTELNDKFETLAMKSAFGDAVGRIAISSTKGTTGHALGAAGGLESIICVMAIRSGIVPPTINYTTPDPECDLDVTPNTAREMPVKIAMNNNLGFGGHNGSLLFRKFEN